VWVFAIGKFLAAVFLQEFICQHIHGMNHYATYAAHCIGMVCHGITMGLHKHAAVLLFKSASLYTKHAILTIKTDTHTSKSPVKSMAVCLRYRPARNPAPTKINVQKRAYGWGEIEGSQSLTLTQHHARFYPIFKN
jgi:hypothetical protein